MSDEQDRIIKVVQKFLDNPDFISDVTKSDDEYYFKYKTGHFWSMVARRAQGGLRSASKYVLYLYPDWNGSCEELAKQFESGEVGDIKVAGFPELIDSEDGQNKLKQLYGILRRRFLNIDSILDDILED